MHIPTNTQAANVFSSLTGGDSASPLPNPAELASIEKPDELREAFDDFVGQTFFQQMLSAMRKTVDKPAYFDGGRTEEVFQGQLDQVLSEQMSKASAKQFSDPMFELYSLGRA